MKLKKIPIHVSFIMDGNNRWSKKYKKSKFESYKIGANNLFKIANYIFKNFDTKFISAFALSTHNLKRSKSFLQIFNEILDFYFKEINNINHEYQINFIGDLTFLPKKKQTSIFNIQKINKDSKKKLFIFINYSGQNDITNTIKSNQKLNVKFENKLLTGSIPNPDLLFRSGGFQRISDFMLYQIAFTELFFSKKLWPEININDIKKIFYKYSLIERKFGI